MITIGSYVTVPQTPGNISHLSNTGYVTAILEPYCKVLIRYGRNNKGTWQGLITDLKPPERQPQEEK